MNCSDYDKRKIGKLIGRGGDKKVYEYGNDQVIKFSRLTILLGEKFAKKLIYDYEVCKNYLGDFIVPCSFLSMHNSKNKHIQIQEKVKGKELDFDSLKNSDIANEFTCLLKRVHTMEKETGQVIDLIGREGFSKGILGNVVITKDNKLRIFDATFLESRNAAALGFIVTPLMNYIQKRQKKVIKKLENSIVI